MTPSSHSPSCFRSRTPEATRRAAGALARCVSETGIAISLNGELGAGKTVFVKGLAGGLGLDPDEVSSPTFTLVNEYPLPSGQRLVHADFYRFESEDALDGVGFLDYLDAGTVLVAEWGDRFPRTFPKDHLRIEIVRGSAGGDADLRSVDVQSGGPRSAALAQLWLDALAAPAEDDGALDVSDVS